MTRRIVHHHTSYTPEVTICIYDGEHEILTKLKMYSKKTVSQPFLVEVKKLVDELMPRAHSREVMEQLKSKQKPKKRRNQK